MMGGQKEEDYQLHDVPITVSRSYKKQQHRLICYNSKTRRIYKANEESKGSLSIMNLPDLVLVNILSRLPIKSILHSKCVCKVWCNLITNPYFAETHLANSPYVSILVSPECVLSHMVELKREYDYTISPNKAIYAENRLYLGLKRACYVIGSCNGVLCLFDGNCYGDDHVVYISNPILRECVRIPTKPGVSGKRVRYVVYGFGYSLATRQFKILRIANSVYIGQPGKTEAAIYTIGVDKSWRDLGDFPLPNRSRICGVTFNGALHWIEAKYPIDDVRLFSFDLAEEKVRALPSPHGSSESTFMEVGVLGNCLCIFDNKCNHQLDIWWMRDYGVGESWTRDRILKSWSGPGYSVRPITLWRNGEIVMVSCYGSMFSYDPKQKKSTNVDVSVSLKVIKSCGAIGYFPSFFSLKDVMGEDVQMIQMDC